MPESNRERRRRARSAPASEPVSDAARSGEDKPDAAQEVESKPAKGDGVRRALASARSSPVWPLVTGLAIGFAAGREAYRFGLGDGTRAAPEGSATPFIAADKAKVAYAKMSDFPAGYLKDSDIGSAAKVLDGLSDAQKVTVMQALNERDCECGCGMGRLALCLQKDPNCPRSPQMAKLAVDLVKQGKGVKEITDAIDAKQKDMANGQKPAAAPEPPSGPKRVELAAWNPRRGPKAAKVTIVEFSDFQ